MYRYQLFAALLIVCLACLGCANPHSELSKTDISIVDAPNTDTGNDHYIGNRPPLTPSPFIKLPVGAIEPKGWVRKQLRLRPTASTATSQRSANSS